MPPMGEGSPSSRVMIVGECWGDQEERTGLPFQGASGQELSRLLHEAGIMRSECYTTNIVNGRPPFGDLEKWVAFKRKDIQADMIPFREAWVKPAVLEGLHGLLREIELVNPNVIVTCGNLAMWALTGAKGILKWRGSQLKLNVPKEYWPQDMVQKARIYDDAATYSVEGMSALSKGLAGRKLIPTVHPSYVLRDPSFWSMAVLDLKRVARERESVAYTNVPTWNFIVRPNFEKARSTLQMLLDAAEASDGYWVDFDLETKLGHIDCAGFSWSRQDAICIPFMSKDSREGYWMEEEEAFLVWSIYKLLTHPKVKVRGQNLLYDAQYTYRHWHFVPNVAQDTMIAHHSAFCGLPKALDFLASMYSDYYVNWKPDKSAWKVGG